MPLEEAAARQKSSSMHNVDTERERTYNLAGSVDAQIKSLAAELREVVTISHLFKCFSNYIIFIYVLKFDSRIVHFRFIYV